MEVKLYSRPNKDGKNVLYVDYMEKKGKRVRRSLNLLETKANIAYVYKHIIPEIEQKIKFGVEFREYKMSEFTSAVLEYAKKHKKLNTFILYSAYVNRFHRIMGDVTIDSLTVRDMEKYISVLESEGLSGATIKLALVPIKLAFKEAMRHEIIFRNPLSVAIKPKVITKVKNVFNLMQMHNIINNAEGDLKTFLYFAFYTGARPGEISALRWSDIDHKSITISRTEIQQGKYENLPKSNKIRKIALLQPLKEYIDTLKKEDDKIFPFMVKVYQKQFKKLLLKLGYDDSSLHVTRHTFASLLLKAREEPTLVQYFLGHSSLNMLNKVYAHYIEDEKDVDRIGKFLAQI